MQMQEIISKKRHGEKLLDEEIAFFIKEYVKGTIPDYQASSFCMAVCCNGMDAHETAVLTDCMMHSGDVVDLSKIPGVKVDKHSTGGVGDKTSLVLGPLVASAGVKLAKMSGRGLGFTGGTLDKMESIPGMRIDLTQEEFFKQVSTIGMAIIGQTGNLVPADKKLYALRDVTGTVDSIPLIASSIMSKKLASGSDSILLDVKFGSGAFMKTMEDARLLAKAMVKIGNSLKRNTKAILTDMSQPLGFAVGNILEVKEAIATLKGNGPKDFVELCLSAGSIMLVQANVCRTKEEARKILEKNLNSGLAYKKFLEFVEAQGGDISYIEHPEKFDVSKNIVEVKAEKEGYCHEITAIQIGLAAMHLGAGRATKEDSIDYTAGIVLNKKVGDKVLKGETLATIYTNKNIFDEEIRMVKEAFILQKEQPEFLPIVRDIIEE